MREIALAKLDKTRPVLILTREAVRHAMHNVTVAPITTTIKGLSTEVRLGSDNGLNETCVASIDNIVTIPVGALGKAVGYLLPKQERSLADAFLAAFDLEL